MAESIFHMEFTYQYYVNVLQKHIFKLPFFNSYSNIFNSF